MNLSSLGVPLNDQSRVPSNDSFPLTFNRNTEKLWPIAVGQTLVKEPKKAWESCIKTFVKLCDKEKLSPFSSFGISNDEILTSLIRCRRIVVKFMEQTDVLSDMQIYRNQRSVKLTNTGFSLRIDAQAKLKKDDPTILSRMGLRKNSSYGGIWSRSLDNSIDFFVFNEGAKLDQRWHFGYEIRVDKFPYIPGNPLPSNAELEKFVLEVLYLPILRAYRPIGGHMRLI